MRAAFDAVPTRFYLDPISSAAASGQTYSIRLLTLQAFAIQSALTLTVLPVPDNSTTIVCEGLVGDGGFQGSANGIVLVGKVAACLVTVRVANKVTAVLPDSFIAVPRSLSGRNVILRTGVAPHPVPKPNATIWTGATGLQITNSEYYVLLQVASVSESLSVSVTDTAGHTLATAPITLVAVPDASSTLTCPSTVPLGQPISCSIAAFGNGSIVSVFPKNFKMVTSGQLDQSASGCGGSTGVLSDNPCLLVNPSTSFQCSIPVTPVGGGLRYVNLCFRQSDSQPWAWASTVTVSVVEPASFSRLSCRRKAVTATAAVNCFLFGFTDASMTTPTLLNNGLMQLSHVIDASLASVSANLVTFQTSPMYMLPSSIGTKHIHVGCAALLGPARPVWSCHDRVSLVFVGVGDMGAFSTIFQASKVTMFLALKSPSR